MRKLVICLTFVIGCVLVGCNLPTSRIEATDPFVGPTIQVPDPSATNIVVETVDGDIEVSTGMPGTTISADWIERGFGGTQATADASLKQVVILTPTLSGQTVHYGIGRKDGSSNRDGIGASIHLKAPLGLGKTLNLSTTNGNIIVSGTFGDVIARTTNGKIDVRSTTGALTLTTTNGPIDVDGGKGPLNLNTSSAGITVKATDAVMSASTTSGDITFMGQLDIGHHTFSTQSGNILLALSAASNYHLNAGTGSGQIASEFAITSTSPAEVRFCGELKASPSVSIEVEPRDDDNGRITIAANSPITFSGTLSGSSYLFQSSNRSIAISLPRSAHFLIEGEANSNISSQVSAGASTCSLPAPDWTNLADLDLHTARGNIEIKQRHTVK